VADLRQQPFGILRAAGTARRQVPVAVLPHDEQALDVAGGNGLADLLPDLDQARVRIAGHPPGSEEGGGASVGRRWRRRRPLQGRGETLQVAPAGPRHQGQPAGARSDEDRGNEKPRPLRAGASWWGTYPTLAQSMGKTRAPVNRVRTAANGCELRRPAP